MIALSARHDEPVTASASLSPGSSRWGRGAGIGLAAVWLVFLVWPARAVLALGDPVRRGLGVAALVVFAVAYLAVFARPRTQGAFTASDTGRHDRRGASLTIGPMVAAMIALTWLVGAAAAGLTVFLAVAGTVELTARRAAVLVVSMAAVTAVVAVQTGQLGDVILPFIILVSSLALWSSRRIISDNARLRQAEGELAAMRVVAERERVARDVHDILGHTLTVLTIKAQVADRLVDDDPARAHAELAEIEALTRNALADVRSTVTRLRVPDLAEQLAASGTALRTAGIGLAVEGDPARVPEEHRPLLAWALREATTNVIRHSGAREVRVRVRPDALAVVDDGRGIPEGASGNGLTGLRERVRAAGAELTLAPDRPGHTPPGTRLEVRFA